jgi:hypothetical protein
VGGDRVGKAKCCRRKMARLRGKIDRLVPVLDHGTMVVREVEGPGSGNRWENVQTRIADLPTFRLLYTEK